MLSLICEEPRTVVDEVNGLRVVGSCEVIVEMSEIREEDTVVDLLEPSVMSLL